MILLSYDYIWLIHIWKIFFKKYLFFIKTFHKIAKNVLDTHIFAQILQKLHIRQQKIVWFYKIFNCRFNDIQIYGLCKFWYSRYSFNDEKNENFNFSTNNLNHTHHPTLHDVSNITIFIN